MTFQEVIEFIGKLVDVAGVAAIVIGALVSFALAVSHLAKHQNKVYQSFRRSLGRSILLGLELLVAADIIRTVAITPDRKSTRLNSSHWE